MIKFKVELDLDEEQLQDIFEGQDVKFSKAKVKRLKTILNEVESDFEDRLLEQFEEFLKELISEEWGNKNGESRINQNYSSICIIS